MSWQSCFENPMGFELRARFQPDSFFPGDKVYFDSFAGLIPAVVVRDVPRQKAVIIKLTAGRGAFKKGETLEMSHRHVVYREQVHTRGGKHVIGPWRKP